MAHAWRSHCIEGGYNKLFNDLRPRLEGGMTAEEAAAQHACGEQLRRPCAVVTLQRYVGLRIGLLPASLFPSASAYRRANSTALVGRVLRPNLDPLRSHRLRLDRYDDVDFDQLREAMVSAGLWLLPQSESMAVA